MSATTPASGLSDGLRLTNSCSMRILCRFARCASHVLRTAFESLSQIRRRNQTRISGTRSQGKRRLSPMNA